MVVAFLALLIALGGTAAAAAFGPFNGNDIIKKHSLSGNRLKNGALTGKQIRLGTLGKVPSARTADFASSISKLKFQTLTLQNGWIDSNTSPDKRPPAVALDAQGVVRFRGQIKCGTLPTACPGLFATLPAGLAPSQIVRLPVNMFNEFTGQMNVGTDGTLTLFVDPQDPAPTITADQMRSGLDGITFPLG